MARRKYPFYSPVSYRTADKVRGGVAGWIYDKLSFVWGLFILWIGLFVALKAVEMAATHNGKVVTNPLKFSDYAEATWVKVLEPIFNVISALIHTIITTS